jgi:hypothetical protein
MNQIEKLSEEAEQQSFPLREAVVFVPILGAAIALSFDVGYFHGVDINLFTLFSVSEHIVFALEALPIGFMIAIYVVSHAALVSNRQVRTFLQNAGFDKLRRHRGPIALGTLAIGVLLVIWALHIGAVFLVAVMLPLGILLIWWPINQRKPSPLYLLFAIAVVIYLSFIFGVHAATDYLERDFVTQSLVTDLERIEAKIIRSGDRGVLFQNVKTRSVGFLRWDAIKKIEVDKDNLGLIPSSARKMLAHP